ncbi:alpha/beta hydrolase [Lysinibacillus sp. 54212]|uniref:alpha/beta hydrolase n=1 Tax=Lysinibacillus sp. 54212 TaxID=3119829 RepID=UPI002FC76ED8
MKRKFMVLSSIVTTVLASITAVSGVILSNKLMYIKLKDPALVLEREKKARRFDEEWFNQCHKQELLIQSPNGYSIKGIFLQPLQTNNIIIICHGVTENKMNSVKYARMYERLGFNTVVYDHRRHGESGGKTTSYGYYEKMDLGKIVIHVRELVGENAIIGIHGESMGAATTLLYAGSDEDQAKFYISDSAFSDFRQLLYLIVKNSISVDLKFAVHLTDLFMRMRDGYWIKNVLPKKTIKKIDKPVLFIHNIHDTFIPYTMTEEMFELKNEPKMLRLFEKGEHSQGFNEMPLEYEDTVREFLTRFVPEALVIEEDID